MVERDRYGGGSVMVWAGVTETARTPLIVIKGNLNAQRYVDDVLRPGFLPFMQRHGTGLILQQDNARPHTASITQEFLKTAQVDTLPWPPRSADFSPIEHLWDVLDRRVRARHNVPNSIAELTVALIQERNAIPQKTIEKCVRSMRRRCGACMAALGGHTRY